MTILKVPDMSCSHCVGRITKALEAEKLSFKVLLENKTVEIDGGEPEVEKAVAALDDAGYDSIRA